MTFKDRAAQDYAKKLALSNKLWLYYRNQLSKILKISNENLLKIVAGHLSLNPNLDYIHMKKAGIEDRLIRDLKRTLDNTALDVERAWDEYRRRIGLHGRMVAGYTARKVTPPWIPIQLNLKDKRGRRGDPWKGLIHYHLANLADLVMRQVRLGVTSGEDLHKILQRIRKLLKVQSNVKSAREAARPKRGPNPVISDLEDNDEVADTWETSEKLFDTPPVEVSEGNYTLEDVEDLRADQVKAMGWDNRAYTPEDEELWNANQTTVALEQSLMSDVIDQLHQGAITVGDENQGIKDFKWVVSKPQLECDVCTDRDGMLMSEIKAQFGTKVFPKGEAYPYDLTQDSPPPLHPHCYCQLIADIDDDWAGDELEKNGFTWDTSDGVAYGDDENETKAGFAKLSFDDWMKKVGGL